MPMPVKSVRLLQPIRVGGHHTIQTGVSLAQGDMQGGEKVTMRMLPEGLYVLLENPRVDSAVDFITFTPASNVVWADIDYDMGLERMMVQR